MFTQVTVSPWVMVSEPGVKLKSAVVAEPLAAAMALALGSGFSFGPSWSRRRAPGAPEEEAAGAVSVWV